MLRPLLDEGMKWFHGYVTDRPQAAEVGGATSSFGMIGTRVTQGSKNRNDSRD